MSIWILESFSLRKAAVEVRGAASGWAGWAIVHPDFAGIEKKRTETDNMLPFAHPEQRAILVKLVILGVERKRRQSKK